MSGVLMVEFLVCRSFSGVSPCPMRSCGLTKPFNSKFHLHTRLCNKFTIGDVRPPLQRHAARHGRRRHAHLPSQGAAGPLVVGLLLLLGRLFAVRETNYNTGMDIRVCT